VGSETGKIVEGRCAKGHHSSSLHTIAVFVRFRSERFILYCTPSPDSLYPPFSTIPSSKMGRKPNPHTIKVGQCIAAGLASAANDIADDEVVVGGPSLVVEGPAKRKRGSAKNAKRTSAEWLAVISLWKQYRLEAVRSRMTGFLAANPTWNDMYADAIQGVGVGSFLAAVKLDGYGGDAVDRGVYVGLTRQALQKKIYQEKLQLLHAGRTRAMKIEDRVAMINEEIEKRRFAEGEPLAKVMVWYDTDEPSLGYQSLAKERLVKGELIGYYKGDWVLTKELDTYQRDGSYSLQIPKCEGRTSYFLDPDALDGTIISTDPFSCHGRYINCTMEPANLDDAQASKKRGRGGKSSSGEARKEPINVKIVYNDNGSLNCLEIRATIIHGHLEGSR
jgi:hypothetical protein